MMKQTFILCAVIAFTGAIINIILSVSGEKNISKIISCLLGIILLLTLCKAVSNEDFSRITFDLNTEENSQINKDTIEEAIENSEKEIKKEIQTSIEKQFNSIPISIDIEINYETIKIEKMAITMSHTDIFISTYELKNFIKSKFQIDAEVYFV